MIDKNNIQMDPDVWREIQEQFEKIKEESGVGDTDEETYQKDIEELLGFTYDEMDKEMNDMVRTSTVEIEVIHEDAVLPTYAYPSDSGFDLHSIEEVNLPAFGRAAVSTGLKLGISEGYEIQVRSKSGLALKMGLTVLNSPGTVDCFSEDMKILTIDGEKNIKDIEIGEVVFSFNEETLQVEKDFISHIYNTDVQDIIVIETEDGILEITPNTEVYTNNGIKYGKDLNETDEIITF
jgi:deoxyuridine 5'-triphosphate nucleotidohydrolase